MTDELKVGLNKCLSAKRKCMQKVDIRCPRNLCLTSVQCQQRAFVRVSYYEHWLTDCTDRGINASRTSQWRTTMMRSSHALVCVHRRRRTFRKGIYLHYVNEEWVRRSFSQARRSPFLRERGKKSQDGDLLGSCLTPTHKNGNVRTEQADRAHKLPVCDQLPTSVLWCFGGRERGKHIFSCVRLLVKRSLLHFSRENRDRSTFLLEPRDEIPNCGRMHIQGG